jgi:hypothetical protein
LVNRLKDEQLQSVRKAFLVYINRVWKGRKRFTEKPFEDLEEVSNMLRERIEEWEQEWMQKEIEKGFQEAQQVVLRIALQFLEQRFPLAPTSLKEKLERSSCEELECSLQKILNAQDLEELLEDEITI